GAAATGATATGAAATGAGTDPDAPTADSSLRVSLETPIRGVAPGQTLVLYDGDRVIAAATLERRA
ncbi:MAG: aminomethyltransferase beta-barrel domain-containing protein, partial [Brachybacterium alimentarium]